jgi:DNA-binding CsgD family transcriptional regulator
MAKTALPQSIESPIVALVREIHAASDAEREWAAVLGGLRNELAARSVTLGQHEFNTGRGSTLWDAPHDAAYRSAYADFAARNPWFLSSDDYQPGRVMTGDELISNRELQRTDFYRGFLKPHGLFHRLCGVVARRGDLVHFVAAHRGEDQPAFGVREKADLQFLLAHLSLSMENRWRTRSAADLSQALMRVVDQDPSAVLLVSAEGDLVYRNPMANELLARSTSLQIDGPRLIASNGADQRALRQAIGAAAAGTARAEPADSRVITLGAPSGTSPLVLIVRPAGDMFLAESGAQCPIAMISIRGGHAIHDPASCPFARQFELTPAQSKVSALVFTGQRLAVVARSLNVSENTVRSHLKQIFQKTNTHGQMELVHLHARMCTNRG